MSSGTPKSASRDLARDPVMVRKQFLLTPEQNARLKAHAAASGHTEAEIVRAGLDMALQQAKTADDAWKAAWSGAAGAWSDRGDLDQLDDERRRLRALRRQRAAGSGA